MKKTIFTLLFIFCLMSSTYLFAAEPRLEASLENSRVSTGESVYLYVTFYGGQSISAPDMQGTQGLMIKYIGEATKISVVNGKMTQSITHTYIIMPQKSGTYQIGPFFTGKGGNVYRADAVTLVVGGTRSNPTRAPAPPQAPRPTGAQSSATDDRYAGAAYKSDKVFLTMEIGKRVVYVNEVVPLTIKVYVNNIGLKEIEYPTYASEGFSANPFSEPERRREVRGGVTYDVLIFKQELSGIKEGNYVLGPAKLNSKLMVRDQTKSRRSSFFRTSVFDDDFFSSRFGYKTYPIELESNELPVSILALPKNGKPAGFQGAVGDYRMEAYIDPIKAKVGDPVVLKTTISGRGSLDTVTAPKVSPSDKFKTYEPQVTIKGNKKTYEQILIPKTIEAGEVPEVSFSFFNPQTKQYTTLKKGPFPLDVLQQPDSEQAVKMVSMPGEQQIFYPQEKFGEDIMHVKQGMGYVKDRGSYLYRNPIFWGGQVLPLILLIFFSVSYKKKERMLSDKSYARFTKAPRRARKGLAKAKSYLAKGEMLPFYDTAFKTLQDYLGGRFGIAKGSVTVEAIEDKLSSTQGSENALSMLREVFSKCEMARYASSVSGGSEAGEVLDKVKRIIDYMEKAKA